MRSGEVTIWKALTTVLVVCVGVLLWEINIQRGLIAFSTGGPLLGVLSRL
jgi:hypothetical protein